ncbi:hypothetical protein PX699_03725 [Sphingobium sp. H39-3-25]|nr:hypothetical protein [Sphingobium arseniciresistens]
MQRRRIATDARVAISADTDETEAVGSVFIKCLLILAGGKPCRPTKATLGRFFQIAENCTSTPTRLKPRLRIRTLDEAAKAEGVVLLSAASSIPALSGAEVRHLARGMDKVRAVEMAMSASNKATAGQVVPAAILGQVGRPVRTWRGQRWTTG